MSDSELDAFFAFISLANQHDQDFAGRILKALFNDWNQISSILKQFVIFQLSPEQYVSFVDALLQDKIPHTDQDISLALQCANRMQEQQFIHRLVWIDRDSINKWFNDTNPDFFPHPKGQDPITRKEYERLLEEEPLKTQRSDLLEEIEQLNQDMEAKVDEFIEAKELA